MTRFPASSLFGRLPETARQGLLFALAAVCGLATNAPADTWNNGTGTALWSSNGNWVDTSEPTINDPVTFNIGFPGGNTGIRLAVGELAATLTLNDSYTLGPVTSGADASLELRDGSVTVASGKSAIISARLNSSTAGLTKAGTGTLTLSNSNVFTGSVAVNAGILAIANPGSVSASATSSIAGSGGSGKLTVTGPSSLLSITGSLQMGSSAATSTLEISDGALVTVTSDLSDATGSTNTITINGGGLMVNNAISAGFAANCTFTQNGGYVSAGNNLRIGAAASGNGHYTLDNGGIVEAGLSTVGGTGGFPGGKGRLDILNGSMSLTGRLKIWNTTDTIVNMSGGFLSVGELDTTNTPARFNWTAGTVHVTTCNSSLTNQGGVLSPGHPVLRFAGNTTINGSYTQQTAGAMQIELGGPTPGSQFDRVDISGAASLNGALNLALIDGFGPLMGQSFVITTYASHSGTFSQVTGMSAGPGRVFRVQYNPGNVTLVVGEPVAADLDQDGDVDAGDLTLLESCRSREGVPHNGTPLCQAADFDDDNDVDLNDFGKLQRCFGGSNVSPPSLCVQ